ncbi:hypothetical protein [Peribacillus loiseleuriae]|uniref:hypothetical protein n=1 Tax=Peribacillus loiseleuriae TaxID=1679170 RepID=UPI000ACBAFC9
MKMLDLIPTATIKCIPVKHELNAAHMGDGCIRVKGKAEVVPKYANMNFRNW